MWLPLRMISSRDCLSGSAYSEQVHYLQEVGGILLLHFYFGVGINTAIHCVCQRSVSLDYVGFTIKTE